MSDAPELKNCTRCNESKPATLEHFSWAVKGKYLSSRCKLCLNEVRREKQAANPQHFSDLARKRREADPEGHREAAKKHRLANPEKYKEYAKRSYERNGETIRAGSRRWWHENKERLNAEDRDQRKARRAEMIAAYGGKCECCGETEPAFLTLEHIHRDGKAHRAQFKSPEGVYNDLRRRGWPKEGLTLLCWCCQMARAFHGSCPHERGRQLALGLGEVA